MLADLTITAEGGGDSPPRKVRRDPTTGFPAATDVIRALTGTKNARPLWHRIKARCPALMQQTHVLQMRAAGAARGVDVVTVHGFTVLLTQLRTNATLQIQQQALGVLQRVFAGDATLAADIIDRNDNPEELAWLARRAHSKMTHTRLTDAIKACGGTDRSTYARVNDYNDQVITGSSAQELRQLRQSGHLTRNGLSVEELTELSCLQLMEAKALEQRLLVAVTADAADMDDERPAKRPRIDPEEAIVRTVKSVADAFVRLNDVATGAQGRPPTAPVMTVGASRGPLAGNGHSTTAAVAAQLAAVEEQMAMIDENREHLPEASHTLEDLRALRLAYTNYVQ